MALCGDSPGGSLAESGTGAGDQNLSHHFKASP
jgi:hypothetical protein